MIGIWGNVHTQVNDLNMKQYRKAQKDASDGVIRMRQPWEIGEDEGKVDPALKKAAEGRRTTPSANLSPTSSEPKLEEYQKASFTGSKEDADKLFKEKTQGIQDVKIAEGEVKAQEEALKTSIQNAGEMQVNFEDITQEIAGYDKSELREALRLQTEKLAKAEWDKRGEPELNMIKQLIKYLDQKIKTKK
jgi:hypothetical protein